MEKFLIEAECAHFTDHHLFWCSKCNTNKVDSLEHGTGRFFCLRGQEYNNAVGDPKQIVFALCTGCLSTDLWSQDEDVTVSVDKYHKPYTWNQVLNAPYFMSWVKSNDIDLCVTMAAQLMNCSQQVARELVISLLPSNN